VGDIARAYYRPKAEEEQWRAARDPIALQTQYLLTEGITDPAALEAVERELVAEMDAAVSFALEAPYPDPARVAEDIYA
jgi:pyruvate dehydrogenase E1 component alpha subunit